MYSIEYYVIKFASDLRQVGGFLQYNWKIVETTFNNISFISEKTTITIEKWNKEWNIEQIYYLFPDLFEFHFNMFIPEPETRNLIMKYIMEMPSDDNKGHQTIYLTPPAAFQMYIKSE